FDQVVEVHQVNGDTGPLCFVVSILAESAGGYIKPFILGVTSAEETPDGLSAHCSLSMLDLDDNAGSLKAKSIRRGDDVLATIRARRRDSGLVAHRTKQTGHEFLHL